MVNLDQFFQDIQWGCQMIKARGSSDLIEKAEMLEARLYAAMDLIMEVAAEAQQTQNKVGDAFVLQGKKGDEAIAEFFAIKAEMITIGECFIIEAKDNIDPSLTPKND